MGKSKDTSANETQNNDDKPENKQWFSIDERVLKSDRLWQRCMKNFEHQRLKAVEEDENSPLADDEIWSAIVDIANNFRKAKTERKPGDISIGKDSWIRYIDIDVTGNTGDEHYIDSLINKNEILEDFWDCLETVCISECCGLGAFDFTPERITQAASYTDSQLLKTSLSVLKNDIREFEFEVLGSKRFSYWFHKDFFIELLNHIIKNIPATNS